MLLLWLILTSAISVIAELCLGHFGIAIPLTAMTGFYLTVAYTWKKEHPALPCLLRSSGPRLRTSIPRVMASGSVCDASGTVLASTRQHIGFSPPVHSWSCNRPRNACNVSGIYCHPCLPFRDTRRILRITFRVSKSDRSHLPDAHHDQNTRQPGEVPFPAVLFHLFALFDEQRRRGAGVR